MSSGSTMAEGGSTALIVIDMLNRYEHADAELLLRSAREIVPVLAGLIETARQNEILTVYVNDNHGDWTAGPAPLSHWGPGWSGSFGDQADPAAR
jgi:nicotinamidase-related amidase